MSKYDFLCENCGVIEVEHSMEEPHPETCTKCGGRITRFFGGAKKPAIIFVESEGGGVDDWACKRWQGRSEPTSEETDVPYR